MTQDHLKVLLIEHDPGFARHVGDLLGQARDLSAEMRSTADLRGGLSALTGDRFDVALMDLSVPDGAGLGNVSLIKAEAPQLPIIVAVHRHRETLGQRRGPHRAPHYLLPNHLTPDRGHSPDAL